MFGTAYWVRTLPRGGMYWEIHPPRPKRFPKGGDFAPRDPRDCTRAKPEGNLEGRGVQNPHPREISRAEGGVFPNAPRLEAVYGHSLSIIREILIFFLATDGAAISQLAENHVTCDCKLFPNIRDLSKSWHYQEGGVLSQSFWLCQDFLVDLILCAEANLKWQWTPIFWNFFLIWHVQHAVLL